MELVLTGIAEAEGVADDDDGIADDGDGVADDDDATEQVPKAV